MVSIISREDWGSVYGAPKPTLPLGIKTVFIHTFAVPYKKTSLEDSVFHMRGVEKFHVRERKWRGFGYSWAIDTQGRIFEGRGERAAGAHTMNYNNSSYGIGLFGHGDQDAATPAQIESVRQLLVHLRAKNLIAPNYIIRGHREVSTKSCPGNLIYPLVANGTWAPQNIGTPPATVIVPEEPPMQVKPPAHPSVIQHAYLTHLGRYAVESEVATWIPHFTDELYGRNLIANSEEARLLLNHGSWLTKIIGSLGIIQPIDTVHIVDLLIRNNVSRAQIVDALISVRTLQPTYSTDITIDDIAAALAAKLLQ